MDIWLTTYLPYVDNRGHLTDHLPTSSCPRSLWTTPKVLRKYKKLKELGGKTEKKCRREKKVVVTLNQCRNAWFFFSRNGSCPGRCFFRVFLFHILEVFLCSSSGVFSFFRFLGYAAFLCPLLLVASKLFIALFLLVWAPSGITLSTVLFGLPEHWHWWHIDWSSWTLSSSSWVTAAWPLKFVMFVCLLSCRESWGGFFFLSSAPSSRSCRCSVLHHLILSVIFSVSHYPAHSSPSVCRQAARACHVVGTLIINDFLVYQVFPLFHCVLAIIYCVIPCTRRWLKWKNWKIRAF